MNHPHSIRKDAIITVAGTVGVGKSTFTKVLADRLGFKTSMEKVDGNPYLEDYYADFKKWSFHLQIYFLAERFKQQKLMFESGYGYVQDRSIYEDVCIFARLQYENQNMSERDWETYQSLFEAMTMTPYFPHPDVLIYLEGPLDRIIKQIQKRGRQMELNTPIKFWEELYERYQKWVQNFHACPLLKINIEEYDFLNDPDALEEIVKKIDHIISQNPNQSRSYITLPIENQFKIVSAV